MSCVTKLQKSGQLICTFPQNTRQVDAIAVYFQSSDGEERLVLDCARFMEMECDSKEGLVYKHSESNQAEITLPDSFTRESGTFRCHVSGLHRSLVKSCPWPPFETTPLDGNKGSQSSSLKPTPAGNSSHLENGSDNLGGKTAVVIGVCVGSAVIIIAVLVLVVVMLYQRRKRSRGSKKFQWHKDAMAAQDEESRRQFIRTAVGKRHRSISEECTDAAKKVTVPCAKLPHLSVHQPRQTELLARESYAVRMTLSPDQKYLVSTSLPRVFVRGPSGTGKTVVLFLKGKQWMQHGNYVYIVSTWEGSRAACNMLYHVLQQTVNLLLAELAPLQLRLLEYDFTQNKDLEKAVNDLSRAAAGGPLFVLADEAAGPEICSSVKTFYESLLVKVPQLSLWAASTSTQDLPNGWQQKHLSSLCHTD